MSRAIKGAKESLTSSAEMFDEKLMLGQVKSTDSSDSVEDLGSTGQLLNVTEDDMLEAKETADRLTIEETRKLLKEVHRQHARDPNFPVEIIMKIEEFLEPEVLENPEKHESLIRTMKIQAALITTNSPYAEVRAVVDNHDDPSMPASTIRAWIIGVFFSCCISFINSFFDVRLPSISVISTVPQLLAYPAGKFMERFLPDVGFTLFGIRHSLNPGPFNKKEHMLITIMSNVAKSTPYTNYIVWIQVLPQYFNQPYALSVTYQLLIALSTNFIGYGLAGICRRFLVYPSYCVWPSSLVTIALNSAFHDASSEASAVAGPLKSVWRIPRLKFFTWAFALMFVYFWFPNYIIEAMSYFSWITWIAPNNADLATITGGLSGLGLNPLPTFDWNILTFNVDPLMVPFFTTFNFFLGTFLSMFIIIGLYYTNAFNTSFLPINSNRPFDRFGESYNVSRIIDDRGIFDAAKYEAYSPPFLSAANIVVYTFFFGLYSAAVTYGILYHRHEAMIGFRGIARDLKKKKWFWQRKRNTVSEVDSQVSEEEDADALDVHNRLMKQYKEVPEWWYMICLAIAIVVGMIGIAAYPTNTSPFVVFYGIALCLLFIVPIGIIAAMTGLQVTLNVIAEFIGGIISEGNAIAMCFFKSYGYVTCAHALSFSADLKLAHYLKIPPRFTFWAQMVPTLVSTFISVAVIQYQVNIPGICTPDAPFRFTCPGPNTFFTAAVFWGTVGPLKIWGIPNGQYASTLIGFPLGVVIVGAFYLLSKKYPRNAIVRNAHPVVMIGGALAWAPFNLAYIWPAVPIAAFSWLYLKKRFLGLWSKYNFVTSAAFSAAIAVSGICIFFALQVWDIELDWAGNSINDEGCDPSGSCQRMTLAEGQFFGPDIGQFS